MAVRDYWLARTGLETAMSGVTGFSVRAERPQMELSEPSTGQEIREH
jgi:hypothetical protein